MNRFSPRRVSGITQTALMAPFDSCHPRGRAVGGPGKVGDYCGMDVGWEAGGAYRISYLRFFLHSFLGFWNFSTWNTFICVFRMSCILDSINSRGKPKHLLYY